MNPAESFPRAAAERFWSSGHFLVHQVDPLGMSRVIKVEHDDLDHSSFLDHRIKLGGKRDSLTLSIGDLARTMPAQAPARGNYICHISHVGSTLISKLLGLADGVICLREPMLLRWLADLRATAGEPESLTSHEEYQLNLKLGIALLNRPFQGRDHILVKATSYANPVIRDALAIQPEARVLAIFTPVDSFAANILKKRDGMSDILGRASIRLKRLHGMLGFQRWRLFDMSPGELTGMSWLAQMVTLGQAQLVAGNRFKWLDFEAFLAEPEAHLADLFDHFGIAWGADGKDRLQASGLLGKYSKNEDIAYTVQHRAAEIAQARKDQAEEIEKSMRWVESALAEHPELLALASVAQQDHGAGVS